MQLAPATAEVIADLVLGRPPRMDLAPFRPDRPPDPSERMRFGREPGMSSTTIRERCDSITAIRPLAGNDLLADEGPERPDPGRLVGGPPLLEELSD